MSTNLETSRIAGDRGLLAFKNYEEYLDSLIGPADLSYLESSRIARRIAELGYRTTGETIPEESFEKRQKAVRELLFPTYRPYVLDSELAEPSDELQRQLAFRERANRLGVVSTIIYVRESLQYNREISGYIDYADRLKRENWHQFFSGKRILFPRKTDLAYYNWRLNKTLLNDTANYRPIVDKKRGLCFANIHDRIIISVDPKSVTPGIDATRVRVYSPLYDNVVLYDHAVRR